VAAGGKPGGFSAPGGVATKLRLLTIEGAEPQGRVEGPMLFDRLPLAAARPRR
jgi:methylated-DNA-[protein]-cysteine S-methyltransferase